MAHAYSTIARGGALVSGTLASTACAGGLTVPKGQHVVISQAGLEERHLPGATRDHGGHARTPRAGVRSQRAALPPGARVQPLPRQGGAGDDADGRHRGHWHRCRDPENLWIAGKTGTTSSYEDAWFVGYSQALPGLPDA